MKAQGYMVEAEWDGAALRVAATSKMSRVALLGEDHEAGQVVIPREQLAGVELSRPKLGGAINGNFVVRTVAGKTYQLHFRKKDATQFEQLAAALR